ncbi:MAG: GTPase ObgE, partial [Dechloromonas sp.]|nr:GTPase ObgE [Dechloromonas sp.]
RGRQQSGAAGDDVVLKLPAGTVVLDTDTGEQLFDVMEGDRVVLAQGGEGGLGNEHFKSATNQTPDQFTRGTDGEHRELTLELKLIADVGLIGKPNAGKSTLLSAVTRATPKVDDYPFTTLKPQLGIAELDVERRLVLADIPGLIEGASQGVGLGHRFLRHVERTRVLVHLIEFEPSDGSDVFENYRTIREELLAYSHALAEKTELIAISKVELLGEGGAEEVERMVRSGLKLGADVEVYPFSSVTGEGLPELLEGGWRAVAEAREVLGGLGGMQAGRAMRSCGRRVRHEAREAKVSDFGGQVSREHDVFGLDVAMDDSSGARRTQGFANLLHPCQSLVQFRRPVLLNVFGQVAALDVLLSDIVNSLVFPRLIHLNDVRMRESGGRFRFALKTIHHRNIETGHLIGSQQLDRDDAFQRGLFRQIHLRHASGPKAAQQTKLADHTIDQFFRLRQTRIWL